MNNATSPGPRTPLASTARYRSAFRSGLFDGKTVIVTGGGSGLGRCTVHELASLGARVALIGRQTAKLEAVADEIATLYPERAADVSRHVCDIRIEDGVERTVAEVIERHGRIDGLYNCAGGQYPAALRDISLKGWDAVVRNNLHGTFLFSREVYRQWMEGHGGAIVNMLADIWGGLPGMGHSGAARGGVLTFTETAACEWGHAGVRVNAVAPGWIASNGMDHYDEAYRKVLRDLPAKVPLQRFGTEAELSSAVVYLLSEAAAFITGTVIRVDGGVPTARHTWTLQPAERTSVYQGFPQYRPPSMLDGDAAPADSAPAEPQAARADPDRPTDRRTQREAGPARGASKDR
ncbi:MAG: SDR family oxidoreductase [Caldimonas sp.]